jgi:hypothetical protein
MKFSANIALLFIGSAAAFAPANLNAPRTSAQSVCFAEEDNCVNEISVKNIGTKAMVFIFPG